MVATSPRLRLTVLKCLWSRSVILRFSGLNECGFYKSKSYLRLRKMPKRKQGVQDSDDNIHESPKKKIKNISSQDEAMLSMTSEQKKTKKKAKASSSSSSSPAQIKGKKKSKVSDDVEESDLVSDKVTDNKSSPKKTSPSKKSLRSKGFVLFVGQIPHHMTKKDVEKHFASTGGVKDVRLLIYPDSGRSRGCAYVEFVDKEHLKLGLKLNESTLGGGKLRVEYPYQGGKKYAKNNKSQQKKWKAKKSF